MWEGMVSRCLVQKIHDKTRARGRARETESDGDGRARTGVDHQSSVRERRGTCYNRPCAVDDYRAANVNRELSKHL